MVLLSYKTLNAPLKDSKDLLADKLFDECSSMDSKRIINLPKNDFNEKINFILICDEGFRIV